MLATGPFSPATGECLRSPGEQVSFGLQEDARPKVRFSTDH